jgi:hypothetical protein
MKNLLLANILTTEYIQVKCGIVEKQFRELHLFLPEVSRYAFNLYIYLMTDDCQLSTVNCQLSTVNRQLSTVNDHQECLYTLDAHQLIKL